MTPHPSEHPIEIERDSPRRQNPKRPRALPFRFRRSLRGRPYQPDPDPDAAPAAPAASDLHRDLAARRAFRGLARALAVNIVRSTLRESLLRTLVILVCSLFFWATLYVFFHKSFVFLAGLDVFADSLIDYGFSLYFLSIMFMLFFSVGIIGYNALFLSRECEFLLTLPADADRVFAHRFAEALFFACWGFVLIGTPLLVAYGVTRAASPLYYLYLPPYLVGFCLVPGSLGACAAFLVGYFLPRRRRAVLAVLATALVAVVGLFAARVMNTGAGASFSPGWFNNVLGQLAFSQSPFWPSVWITRGVVAAANGNHPEALFQLAVTLSNGGMAYLLAAFLARVLYRPAFNRVQGGRSARNVRGGLWFDAAFHKIFAFVSPPVRLLMLKDLRILRRDPAQWSQLLILLGLLGFYFLTIKKLGQESQTPAWRNLLSFLNLAVTSLLLSTFTSRFVYPLLSLEGRNFWILGLFPLRRESILWGKFAFAAGTALVSTVAMVVLSDLMLRVGIAMLLVHVLMMVIICLGLAGISVGLGARFPNLRETDPSKIVSGFGGTLNLLLSLVFILVVVLAVGLPSHLYLQGRDNSFNAAAMWLDQSFRLRIGLAIAAALAVGALAVAVPMRVGLKAFREIEL